MVVLGPTGYIGRYVTKELIRRGYKVGLQAQRRAHAARTWLTLPRGVPTGGGLQPRAQRRGRQEEQGGRGV